MWFDLLQALGFMVAIVVGAYAIGWLLGVWHWERRDKDEER